MKKRRYWTDEEDNYLLDKAGSVSSQAMADNLGRTKIAVDTRMYKLGIGDIRVATGMITANQLSNIVNIDDKTVYMWIRESGLKATHKRIRDKGKFFLIKPSDFWEWADKNRNRINFSKIEPKILLPEPEWFEEQRRRPGIVEDDDGAGLMGGLRNRRHILDLERLRTRRFHIDDTSVRADQRGDAGADRGVVVGHLDPGALQHKVAELAGVPIAAVDDQRVVAGLQRG